MGTASWEITRIFGYSYCGMAVRSPICWASILADTLPVRIRASAVALFEG